jgi:tol-pal system protein YbgF
VGFYRRIRAQTGGFLLAGLLMPAALAAGAPEGGRDLPPVVEMGVDNAPATRPSPTREAMADLLQQLETLQAEVRQLRGQIEVQGNEIERLKARQRDLLADMDRRISALEQRNAPGASSTAAPAGATASTAPAVSAQEQQAYDAAFGLMKQGYYDRAAKGFRDFIAKYPQSALRDNAQYWLGQAYYVSRNFRQALVEFGKVVSDHPNSTKVPDAALKIGYSHYELGEWSKARDSLNQVVSRYPGTPAAKSAQQRLAQMKKEKK